MFALALLLSGFAALAYQVAWQRVLTQVLGADAVSAVLIVTIFMLWLGVGAEASRRLLRYRRTFALRAYMTIEIIVGLYGVISVPLLRYGNEVVAAMGIRFIAVDTLLNLLLLAVPIVGMGMTTPLIVHVAKERLSNVGRTAGLLYGANIAGAAAGALVTGLVLIELFGLRGTTVFGAVLNGVAAAVAFALLRADVGIAVKQEPAEQRTASLSRFNIAAVLFGFGTLALQIIFFRVLSNYLTLSTIVFPIVLSAYLCLMSAGQWLGGALADRYHDRLPMVAAFLFAAGAMLILAALQFPPAWAAPFGALRFTNFNGSLIAYDYPGLIGDPNVIIGFFFAAIFMLAVLPWSGLFPLVFRIVTTHIDQAGDRFARTFTLYTIGNVAGTFATGIVLLPLLGTGGTAAATVLVVGGGAWLLCGGVRDTGAVRRGAGGLVLAGCAAALLVPSDYYRSFRLGDYAVADVFEGRTGVATVVPTTRFYSIVDMNRTASASALQREPGPADQYEAWRWNHTELMALDPGFRPKDVLIIGIGHAYLVDALLDLDFIETITVVDLSSEIVAAVRAHTRTGTRRVFDDPRVEIVIADGRRYVQNALKEGKRFDLIQNKINEPWHAGSSNLFTVEFFRLQKRLLRPNGYLGVRPLVGHVSDGLKVFSKAVWPGYYHVFFPRDDFVLPQVAVVTSDIREAWEAGLPGGRGGARVGRSHLDTVVFDALPAELQTDTNSDDHPTFEYFWLRRALGIWRSPRIALSANVEAYKRSVPVRLD